MRARRESGFTIIEAMIALAILAFGVLAVSAAQLAALKSSRSSRSLTEAMYLAEQQMELFYGMSRAEAQAVLGDANYPNDTANPIDPDPNDQDQTTYDRSWQIQMDTPTAGLATFTVRVNWSDHMGIDRQVTLQSMRAGL